jgi:superfamily II DNA or RNA helicase
VNVGVLTVGYDFPRLDTVIIARPTMSLALYYQMIGRSVRPHPEKTRVIVYDLVDNYAKFGNPMYMRLRPDKTGNYVLYSDSRSRLTGPSPRDYSDESERLISFGKYKGKKVSDVPMGYLVWCTQNFDDGDWRDRFRKEIAKRKIAEAVAR